MDRNGHFPLRGSKYIELDKAEELIGDVIEGEDLLVANHRNSPPTFLGDRGQTSWIDIIAMLPALVVRSLIREFTPP